MSATFATGQTLMERTVILSALLRSDVRTAAFLTIVLGAAILVPVLNLLVPVDSALHVPTYLMSLFGKYACYALLAV